jgi:hypothetical protein
MKCLLRDVLRADRPQRKEIIERQRAEGADHAKRSERDMAWRYVLQRGQDRAGVDALQRADQRRDRKGNNEEACSDPKSLPADPFIETAPERGEQSLHSSSRQGIRTLEARRNHRKPRRSLRTNYLKQKRRLVQSNDGFCVAPLSYALHMSKGEHANP